jgi:subtilase family serine protease
VKRSSRFWLRPLAVLSIGAFLASCSGGGGSHPALPAAPNNTTAGTTSPSSATRTLVRSSKFESVTTKGAAFTGGQLTMHVVVNLRNGAGLADYAAGVSTPTDGRYRQYLTPQEIGERFGASTSDYRTVANYFASYGLRVGMWPQRLALTVAGPTARFEKALGTTFSTFTSREGVKLIGPSSGTISLAQALPIYQIADAVSAPSMRKPALVRGASGGPTLNAIGTGYTPQQVATAFDFTGAFAAGYTGKGINIGIVGTGPIMQQDFAAFKSSYGWTGASTLTQVNVKSSAAANTWTGGPIAYGGSPTATPPPVTPPCSAHDNPFLNSSESPTPTCNPEDIEAQIDTEQASLARDANVLFYLAYVPSECFDPTVSSCPKDNQGNGYTAQGLAESDDEIQQAIADNTADVLSLSYGGSEPGLGIFYAANLDFLNGAPVQYDPAGFGPSEFAALASEGIAVFASTGDAGAQGCAPFSVSQENAKCIQYPSSDVSLSAIGGVTVPLNNAGQYLGPITVWGQQTQSGGGTGGGVSLFIPRPLWETGANVSGRRNVPDASLLGDPETGVGVTSNIAFGGGVFGAVSQWGGTSVSTPEMAAMWALVLDACKQTPSCNRAAGAKSYRLGNAAPYLWKIYNTPTSYPNVFLDVTFGNNGVVGCQQNGSCGNTNPTPAPGFTAGTGYDNDTGIGVPFARHLINAVVGV